MKGKIDLKISENLERDLRSHHNQFWTSVKEFHLDGLLKRVYLDSSKRRLLARWLGNKGTKRIVINQIDFPSSPFLIEIGPEGWDTRVIDQEESNLADVKVYATHSGLIALSDSLNSFIFGMLLGDFKLPLLFNNLRDHYYVMRIFLRNKD